MIPDSIPKWAWRVAVLIVVLLIIAAGYSYLDAATGLLPGREGTGG
jgi:hypothetical protein